MSIETLLEAAKFLELQAQQQQKTRGKKDCTCETARTRVCRSAGAETGNLITAWPAAALSSYTAYWLGPVMILMAVKFLKG